MAATLSAARSCYGHSHLLHGPLQRSCCGGGERSIFCSGAAGPRTPRRSPARRSAERRTLRSRFGLTRGAGSNDAALSARSLREKSPERDRIETYCNSSQPPLPPQVPAPRSRSPGPAAGPSRSPPHGLRPLAQRLQLPAAPAARAYGSQQPPVRRRRRRIQDGAAQAGLHRALPPHLHFRPHRRAGRRAVRTRLRSGRGRHLRTPQRGGKEGSGRCRGRPAVGAALKVSAGRAAARR